MEFKIASLNLCLGLKNKKDLVKRMIIDENIDILCMQETEIEINIDCSLLSFPSYKYESEINTTKSRVGCYVNSNLSYARRTDLEGFNSHLVILDIFGPREMRIINVYRTFNPQNNTSALDFFKYQIELIKASFTDNSIILGDFNLDWSKKGLNSYQFNHYFDYMDENLSDLNIVQMVEFPTWSRAVNGTHRESILDHIYTPNPASVSNLHSITPLFGDHLMLLFSYGYKNYKSSSTFKRSWIKYSKESLCNLLQLEDWSFDDDTVQGTWNIFENKLINIIDTIVPVTEFSSTSDCVKSIPMQIKTKINQRKRLLKSFKITKCIETKIRIKTLDKEIRFYFNTAKRKNVRRLITPGNTQSLWRAVKIARDVNVSAIPKQMFVESGISVPDHDLPDTFARFFDKKVKDILTSVSIDEEVYNGKELINANSTMFMDSQSIKECVLSLKLKNAEGYDRIPQRILRDGLEYLLQPLTKLFELIYKLRQVPDQWLISKTIPVYKNKGPPQNVENYRPIANLCSTSKIFEKLILKRILEIQEQNNVDITRQGQHVFKKKRSTSTLSIELQSIISRALDNDDFALVSSIDLSCAFDVVNIDLLLKRLKIIGLPPDCVELIEVWLKNRCFYVSIDNTNSALFDLLLGTVQGSVLGPILYAIFVSPIFDIVPLLTFADDSYITVTNKNKEELKQDMEKTLEAITKWLKKSGLKVNNEKTDLCLFYRQDTTKVNIKVGETLIESKGEINVLGVLFDSKLQWTNHVCRVIQKADRALNAIKLIRRFFTSYELLQLLTSNYYSILYYNSEVWHLGSLKAILHKQLMSASAKALKVALHYPDPMISYVNLHKMANRATPEMFLKYKMSLLLYRTFNNEIPETDWLSLNFDQILTSRQSNFLTQKTNNYNVGLNISSNKFYVLNGKIILDWLSLPINSYKILCKQRFINF